MDTIEWMKPSLMKIFTSSDEVVRFMPEGPEDVETSQQATDYINWILTRKNNWSEIFLTWATDALLEKVGVIKVFYDETEKKNREEYHDLTDIELENLIAPDTVEVLEHSEKIEKFEDDDDSIENALEQELFNPRLHDVVISRQVQKGSVKIINIAPEEMQQR